MAKNSCGRWWVKLLAFLKLIPETGDDEEKEKEEEGKEEVEKKEEEG